MITSVTAPALPVETSGADGDDGAGGGGGWL